MVASVRLVRTLYWLRWLAARNRRNKVLGSLLGAYVLYMLYKTLRRWLRAQTVQLVYYPSDRNRTLVDKCLSLHSYKPTPWLWNGHLQTLFSAKLRRHPKNITYARTFVGMHDGGHVALDWAEPFHPERPTLLLLHGLTGGSDETYIQWLVHGALRRGLQCVVMNARGCGGSGLSTPRTFSGAETSDLGDIVRAVREVTGPTVPLFAAGYSLGAGVLVKYLGERGTRCGITAAAALSASFDFRMSTKRMEESFIHRHIYNSQLTKNLKEWVAGHEEVLRRLSWLDLGKVYGANTLREFDSSTVVDMFGYKDVWAYYDDASSKRLIDQVAVPLLVLNAADDPIAHGEGIPTHIAKSNDKVFFGITKEGGHVAWCEGLWPAWGSWESRVVPEFFDAIQNSLEFLQEEQEHTRPTAFAPVSAHQGMGLGTMGDAAGSNMVSPLPRALQDDVDDVDDGPITF